MPAVVFPALNLTPVLHQMIHAGISGVGDGTGK